MILFISGFVMGQLAVLLILGGLHVWKGDTYPCKRDWGSE